MDMDKIFTYIDHHQDEYIEKLKEWIKFKTVSANPDCRKICFDFIEHVKRDLEKLDMKVRVAPNPAGKQVFSSGKIVDYPPIILAEKIKDPSKKTVCVYGHLDVQPAEITDGWKTNPFELSIEGELMSARGASDDKGPVLGWLCVMKVIKELKLDLDLNIKFVLESMEESGGIGLTELVKSEKNGFFKDVDYICISDAWWLSTRVPCVTYGTRGMMYYFLEVSGPKCDLHSGIYGGTIEEPMTDLIYIMSKLVDNKGKILIPNVCDKVLPLSKDEAKLYEDIDFDIDDYVKSIGCTSKNLLHDKKVDALMHKCGYPTLSLHGIEGAFSGPGGKTVIPSKVIAKFSLRTVPNMNAKHVHKCISDYINRLIAELNSSNSITLKLDNANDAMVSDYNHDHFKAALRAGRHAYGMEPNLIREGGTIPIAVDFHEILQKSTMVLPMGRGDDGAHSQFEKLNISNFMNGIKMFYAYFKELSLLA